MPHVRHSYSSAFWHVGADFCGGRSKVVEQGI